MARMWRDGTGMRNWQGAGGGSLPLSAKARTSAGGGRQRGLEERRNGILPDVWLRKGEIMGGGKVKRARRWKVGLGAGRRGAMQIQFGPRVRNAYRKNTLLGGHGRSWNAVLLGHAHHCP